MLDEYFDKKNQIPSLLSQIITPEFREMFLNSVFNYEFSQVKAK
jgi:hypothetical protein